jgi:hypothetical protein
MTPSLTEITVELTILTGELFRLSEDGATLEGESAYIHCYLREWPRPARLAVSPGTPKGIRSYFNSNTITCNPNRAAKDIARDIQNRLLPEAREFHVKNMEYHSKRLAELAAHRAAVEPFEKAGFDHITHVENNTHSVLWRDGAKVDITNERVDVTIRELTTQQVLTILNSLKGK